MKTKNIPLKMQIILFISICFMDKLISCQVALTFIVQHVKSPPLPPCLEATSAEVASINHLAAAATIYK